MPRVIGIDPGTVSIDICGLDDGAVFLDRSFPTAAALDDPSVLLGELDRAQAARPVQLVAGPSGYGLPLVLARDLTDADITLACLAKEGEPGGIGGLRKLMRALARSPLPIVMTPGVVHLPTVPAHRKVNRVDMGTADKVCAVALGIHEEARRLSSQVDEVSFIFVECGGAFTAVLAVDRGSIVDGFGGSSGPPGLRASGALDGEVAFLAGAVSKQMLFEGGAAAVAVRSAGDSDWLVRAGDERARLASAWYFEGIAKAVSAARVATPAARVVLVSGRLAGDEAVLREISGRLAKVVPDVQVRAVTGFANVAGQAAQGAALIADGLAGGSCGSLVDAMDLRHASGTVLDHLHVVSPRAARQRLGLP